MNPLEKWTLPNCSIGSLSQGLLWPPASGGKSQEDCESCEGHGEAVDNWKH